MSWQVVGIFDAGGSVAESELWCDAKRAAGRLSARQLVSVGLPRASRPWTVFQTLKDALTTDPRLNVTVIREPDYYAQQSQVLQTIIRTIGFGIAVLMGLGAIFGAVNTMYSAVADPHPRDRDAPRARIRQHVRSWSRCWSRRCSSASSAA